MLAGLRIKHRLWLLIAAALALLAIITLLSLWSQRTTTLDERRQKTRALTENALSLVAHYGGLASAGKMDQATAQENAKNAVGALRYDGDNYFFIVDGTGHMVRHPIKPELDGQDLSGLKDENGVRLIADTVAAATRGKGEFVDYVWPRAGTQKPVPKVSTGSLYAPWGWVVATGIYVDDVDAKFNADLARLALLFAVAAALLLAVAFAITRSITAPLAVLQQAMQHVEDSGDLTRPAAVPGGGEPAAIARVFNAMLGSFRNIVHGVTQSADELLAASSHLAGNASRIRQSSTTQSDATTSSAAAVEEISTSVQHMSANVAAVLDLSQTAHRHADEGAGVVRQASQEMLSIADAVQRATDSVARLGEDSRRISDIVSVIREVADQTNLLALNAAIEAARAGESGRGFAVVADEVRKLAERTAKSTGEISAMIGGIQDETTQAVDCMREVSDRAGKGVAFARTAGESVARIDTSSAEVLQLISDIADSAREQSTASEQIAGNMARVSEMTQTNAGETADMATSAQQLETMARGLRDSVARFTA